MMTNIFRTSLLVAAFLVLAGCVAPSGQSGAGTSGADLANISRAEAFQRARNLIRQKRYHEAQTLAQRYIELTEQQLGADHRIASVARAFLGSIHAYQKNFDEARRLLEQAVSELRQSVASNDLAMAVVLNDLGNVYRRLRRLKEAEKLILEALTIKREKYGIRHPPVITHTH